LIVERAKKEQLNKLRAILWNKLLSPEAAEPRTSYAGKPLYEPIILASRALFARQFASFSQKSHQKSILVDRTSRRYILQGLYGELKSMQKKYSKALNLIKDAKSIIVTAHSRPDGDACGSISVLCRALRKLGKEPLPIVMGNYDPWIDMLFESDKPVVMHHGDPELHKSAPWKNAELIILADAGHPDRTDGLEPLFEGRKCIVFDHHNTQRNFGDVRVIDKTAAATGIILFRFLKSIDAEFDISIATALFASIATDTGWFRYGSRLKDAYKIAGVLVAMGVDTREVYKRIYEQDSFAKLKLSGRLLDSAEIYFDSTVVGCLNYSDFTDTGARGTDTEGLVNKLQALTGIKVAMMLTERQGGEIRCSLRSEGPVIVREIAEALGGGGHDLAAGVTLTCPMNEAKEKLLAELKKQL
jgi:phosphoesterase RecJ-like protein